MEILESDNGFAEAKNEEVQNDTKGSSYACRCSSYLIITSTENYVIMIFLTKNYSILI